MLTSLLLAITIAGPSAQGATNAQRAHQYYSDGMNDLRTERYTRALRNFEMSVSMARFAFGEHILAANAIRMASSTAILAGDGKKAAKNSKAYIAWAKKDGTKTDVARAQNDLVDALLLRGNEGSVREALKKAKIAVDAASDREQQVRLASLTDRAAGNQAPEPSLPKSSLSSAVIRRTVETVDLTGEADDEPAPTITQATPPPIKKPAPTTPPITAKPKPRVVAKTEPRTPPAPAPAAAAPSTPVSRSAAPTSADGMTLIPAGSFAMGDASGKRDEKPVHEVTVAAFYLDRHEVTNQQFQEFVAATSFDAAGDWLDYAGKGKEQHPVRSVTHADATAFAEWAGKRLPTEQEWERAARGDSGNRYPFGADFDPSLARIGLARDAGVADVGGHSSTAWEIHDLAGNVQEWTADPYDAKAYEEGKARGGRPGRFVARGGAWDGNDDTARSARRYAVMGHRASPRIGFRCARSQ